MILHEQKKNMAKKGFTLIELSIVLVIISLIVGGVIGGRSLVESAKVRSVMTEFKTYDAAFTNFYNQYDAYAGDMSDASDYWAGADNGDGDRTYDNDVGDGYNAWQHLALAEMIPGTYTGGMLGGASGGMDLDVEAPRAEYFDGAGWLASDQSSGYQGSAKYLRIGKPSGNSNHDHAVVGKHARGIDKKLDDGHPTRGKVTSHDGWLGDGLCHRGGSYVLTSSERGCSMYFALTVQ